MRRTAGSPGVGPLTLQDPLSGVTIRQITNGDHNNQPVYFTHPTWSPDCEWLLFLSDSAGSGALWAWHYHSGELVQVSQAGSSWGPFSRHSNSVYYFHHGVLQATDVETLKTREICRVPERSGAPAGIPSESADGTLVAFQTQTADGQYGLVYGELATGKVECFFRWHRRPGHVQCSPVEPALVMFCDESRSDGAVKQRMWLIRTDGTGLHPPHLQQPGELITHESWLGFTGDILYCYWPVSLRRVSADGSGDREVARLNAWHAAASPDGAFAVADTNWPDRGLQLVDVASGKVVTLCASGDCADAPTKVHPHPSFSPDGRRIAFASCRGGRSQVCVVEEDWRSLLDSLPALTVAPPWAGRRP